MFILKLSDGLNYLTCIAKKKPQQQKGKIGGKDAVVTCGSSAFYNSMKKKTQVKFFLSINVLVDMAFHILLLISELCFLIIIFRDRAYNYVFKMHHSCHTTVKRITIKCYKPALIYTKSFTYQYCVYIR